MTQKIFAWVIAAFLSTGMHHATGSDTPSSAASRGAACTSDMLTWDCYGTLEVSISLIDDEATIVVPFLVQKITHFSNQELLVERESFGEKSKETYLVSSSSGVELFDGWELTETPLKWVLDENISVMKVVKAGFPHGPASIQQERQRSSARVKQYIFPIGDTMQSIPTVAYRTDDGKIHIEFNDIGEPIGPYQVHVTWTHSTLDPLPEDYSTAKMKTKSGQQFKNLGEARLLH